MQARRSLTQRATKRGQRELRRLHDLLMDRALGISTETHVWGRPHDPTERNSRNEAIHYTALDIIADRLALQGEDVFCDIGCGFGRACAYFSRLPIAGCVGVELDPDVARQAMANAESVRRRRATITILAGDATEQDYSGATAFFLYNPFRDDVLDTVLTRLRQQTAGRPIKLCYTNPVWARTIDRSGWLTPAEEFIVPYGGARMPARLYQTTA